MSCWATIPDIAPRGHVRLDPQRPNLATITQHLHRRHCQLDLLDRGQPRYPVRTGPRLHQRSDLPRAFLQRLRHHELPGRFRNDELHGCHHQLSWNMGRFCSDFQAIDTPLNLGFGSGVVYYENNVIFNQGKFVFTLDQKLGRHCK